MADQTGILLNPRQERAIFKWASNRTPFACKADNDSIVNWTIQIPHSTFAGLHPPIPSITTVLIGSIDATNPIESIRLFRLSIFKYFLAPFEFFFKKSNGKISSKPEGVGRSQDLGLLLVGSRQVDHQWQIGCGGGGNDCGWSWRAAPASSSIFSSSSASSQAEGNWIFCVCRPVYNRGQSVEARQEISSREK